MPPRVVLVRIERLTPRPAENAPVSAEAKVQDGRRTITVDAAYLIIGNAPIALSGDVAHGPDRYSPPKDQCFASWWSATSAPPAPSGP
ncbi:hypothetical protein [Streptomyces sp. NE06-03C]|uniref:hypothetical protein n=1 Tax=Streptomyces sp. NE06-03C TaxID=3028694 RepID=UPI0029BE60A7|nr:hypothetical protein [Streptomyces sp. NE06-03C]MDX2917064.1 hypothetical protein [Streptomyces sp. NE06-03C]